VSFIKSKVEGADVEVMQLDLADLSSIRQFVKEFTEKYDKLDILINNAGLMFTDNKLRKTKDGFEMHMGVNHLGPFLLTRLLIPTLANTPHSRIVCVASSQLTLATLILNDLMMEKHFRSGGDGMEPYNASKLAGALCIRRLAHVLGKKDIKVFQLCPGFVKTDAFRNDTGWNATVRSCMMGVAGVGPEYGCETVVYCAVDKTIGSDASLGKGEMYRFTGPYPQGTSFLSPEDPKAKELFEKSEALLGLDPFEESIKK